jgi:uncharacterized protein (UPF0332 family)
MATYQSVTPEDRIETGPYTDRAKASLRAAAALRAAGLDGDSVTRAHQACVHAERALLATEKRSPQDLRGVHRMATLHFLQTGQVPREHLAAVERLSILRARADDLPLGAVTAADAGEAVELAAAFVAAVEEWLAANGFGGKSAT